MTMSHSGVTGCGYNVQIAVDNQTQVIAHLNVVDEANDRKQFAPMHEGCEQTLGRDNSRQYTADSGYHSFDQLEYIQEKGVDAVLAEPRIRTRTQEDPNGYFHRGAFTYDSQKDSYTCPAGYELAFVGCEKKRTRRIRVYRASQCAGCALRSQCLKSDRAEAVRQIARDTKEHLAEAMLAKSQSQEGHRRLKIRAKSVEPVFGNLKFNRRFQRFSLRGLKSVRGEFALMCIGHNLMKILGKNGPGGPKMGPLRVKIAYQPIYYGFIQLFWPFIALYKPKFRQVQYCSPF